MNKTLRVSFRVSAEEKQYLESKAKEEGYSQLAHYLQNVNIPHSHQIELTNTDFRNIRLTRRSFRCEEDLWDEMMTNTKNPSQFIRQAIKEKLEKLQNSSQ